MLIKRDTCFTHTWKGEEGLTYSALSPWLLWHKWTLRWASLVCICQSKLLQGDDQVSCCSLPVGNEEMCVCERAMSECDRLSDQHHNPINYQYTHTIYTEFVYSTVQCYSYTYSVHQWLWSNSDMKHGSTQDMTCIVSFDFKVSVNLE